MTDLTSIFNKTDTVFAMFAAVLTYILGKHWYLFVAFLALNIADYVTGWIKSRITKRINSMKGSVGALKKLGYWIMIMLGFGMSAIFVEIGNVIGVNLEITSLLGWFVLASLIINEFRSVLENLVEAGYQVPEVLVKGLEVSNKVLEEATKGEQ